MFIINDNKKIIYWSKGKLGTTTLKIMIDSGGTLEHLGPWIIGDSNDVTEVDWSKFKDYTIFCPIREPRDRYFSGIIEDIYKFYKTFTGSKGRLTIKQFNNRNDWENAINDLISLTYSDMSFGNSYHVANWLWEIVYIACQNNKVNVFHISDWDQHYQDYYNIDKISIEKINEVPMYIKDIVKNIFSKDSYLKSQLDFYLHYETKLYNMILESFVNKTPDFNLHKKDYVNHFHKRLDYFKEKTTQTVIANSSKKIYSLIDLLQQ